MSQEQSAAGEDARRLGELAALDEVAELVMTHEDLSTKTDDDATNDDFMQPAFMQPLEECTHLVQPLLSSNQRPPFAPRNTDPRFSSNRINWYPPGAFVGGRGFEPLKKTSLFDNSK